MYLLFDMIVLSIQQHSFLFLLFQLHWWKADAEREGVFDSPILSLDVPILTNMLHKHLTISSETLLGVLSISDTLSSEELEEL